MIDRLLHIKIAAFLALALAGCGGGSGNGLSTAAVATPSSSSAEPRSAEALPAVAAAPPAIGAAAVAAPSASLLRGMLNEGGDKTDRSPMVPRSKAAAFGGRSVVLPPLPPNEAALQKLGTVVPGMPTQIGVAREVAETTTSEQLGALLAWQPSDQGGRVAALRFQSPGARAVRIGLRMESLPLGGVLRFWADGSAQAYEVATQEVQAAIQRNLDAGDSGEEARTWWSPELGGEAVTVQFELPPGVPATTLRIAVRQLSHIAVDPNDGVSVSKAAGTCNLDSMCNAAYADTRDAVALMSFVRSGASFTCTGTLMNETGLSRTPYFLSAYHCISTQTVASTLSTSWFYRSPSCGAAGVSPSHTVVRLGASLLYATDQTDTSFMRLLGTPPAGAHFSGWSPNGVSSGTAVFDVHHPGGDRQKYSEGSTRGPAGTCTAVNGASCAPTNSFNFLQANWSAGTTEGGSSGSGLFTRIGGASYLVGTLWGGLASCSNLGGTDYFGRFDLAFNAALKNWLSPGTGVAPGARTPIYRLYNNRTRTHFYTANANERDQTVAQYPQFTYEGIGFYAEASAAAANTPVSRFFNTQTGAHFYTVSVAERNNITANYPQFAFEGVSWYVYLNTASQATAMHRFYNTETQTHFYTINATEAQNVQAQYPQFNYEGIGYYAWTSP